MSPHRPKSTRALLRARAAFDSSTPAPSTAGTVFGMSITVVTPPAAAAAVSVPKSSLSGNPGSRLCTCMSMPPGRTYIPAASTMFADAAPARPCATSVTTPSMTRTSASRGPSAVKTVPPRTRSSVKFEVCDAEKRRVGDPRLADVLLPSLATVEDDDEVDDVEAGVAQDLHRTERVATGRHDVLDHRHALARRHAAFELLGRAVALRLLAHEDEREPGLHRHRATEQNGPELGRRKALRGRRDEGRELGAEALEQSRIGLEKELVEVAVRPPSRPKHEIAFQIGSLDQVPPKLPQLGVVPGLHRPNLADGCLPP